MITNSMSVPSGRRLYSILADSIRSSSKSIDGLRLASRTLFYSLESIESVSLSLESSLSTFFIIIRICVAISCSFPSSLMRYIRVSLAIYRSSSHSSRLLISSLISISCGGVLFPSY